MIRPTASSDLKIGALSASPAIRRGLSELLIEVVANGGSVSFMHPLEPEAALAYWDGALAAAARDERVILGAWDGDVLAGTVTLLLDFPPNQPHRAEIAKMMTLPNHRNRGAATALMRAAEAMAIERGRTLLVLDTAVEDGERHELGAGDCLGFGPPSEKTLANESSTSCTYVVALARG